MAKGKGMDPGHADPRMNEKDAGVKAEEKAGGDVLPEMLAKPVPKEEALKAPDEPRKKGK